LLALAACASSPPEHFYTLVAPAIADSGRTPAFSIAIGPVTVPAIVDRPQIVLRLSNNQVRVAEQSRWAQPLEDEIAQAVAADLAQQLGDVPVRVYPERAGDMARYRVRIDVQRFESVPGSNASVETFWVIRDDGVRRYEGHSVAIERTRGAGIEPVVAAHGRALAAVSREIAVALRRLAVQGPGVPHQPEKRTGALAGLRRMR
jgi:uncharacterized lipoprotein YmbA